MDQKESDDSEEQDYSATSGEREGSDDSDYELEDELSDLLWYWVQTEKQSQYSHLSKKEWRLLKELSDFLSPCELVLAFQPLAMKPLIQRSRSTMNLTRLVRWL